MLQLSHNSSIAGVGIPLLSSEAGYEKSPAEKSGSAVYLRPMESWYLNVFLVLPDYRAGEES
jgi:hypothetical protein